MPKKITDEIKNQILKLNEEKLTARQIGKDLNLNDHTVQRYLKSLGLNYMSREFVEIRECFYEYCDKKFEVSKTDARKYCSQSCAAKVNNAKRYNTDPSKLKIARDISEFNNKKYEGLSISEKISRRWNDKLILEDFSTLSFQRIRRRVILEQDGKCVKCNISEWFGKKISLELEHKDGNHHNNKRENLEALCPNCHSITDTWRGRNIKNRRRDEPVKPEEYVQAYKDNDGNIRQALLQLGIAAKGGNYKMMYKYLRIAGIE